MITFRFSGRKPSPDTAVIGMETDQDSETVRFLLPQIAQGQSAQLMMILPDGTPEALQIRDGLAVIPSSVTEIPGRSRCWVEILGGGLAWNSELLYLEVGDLPPISERTEQEYPTAIQDALNACAQAERYRDEARVSAGIAVSRGGQLYFELGADGHLYMYYTHHTPVRFALEEGELVVYGS